MHRLYVWQYIKRGGSAPSVATSKVDFSDFAVAISTTKSVTSMTGDYDRPRPGFCPKTTKDDLGATVDSTVALFNIHAAFDGETRSIHDVMSYLLALLRRRPR